MNISAVVVMIASMIALWGVASWSLVYSMRQEERKLNLIKEQGSFEPYSPHSLHDLERWIKRNPRSECLQEVIGVIKEQKDAMRNCKNYYYEWDDTEVQRLKEE